MFCLSTCSTSSVGTFKLTNAPQRAQLWPRNITFMASRRRAHASVAPCGRSRCALLATALGALVPAPSALVEAAAVSLAAGPACRTVAQVVHVSRFRVHVGMDKGSVHMREHFRSGVGIS